MRDATMTTITTALVPATPIPHNTRQQAASWPQSVARSGGVAGTTAQPSTAAPGPGPPRLHNKHHLTPTLLLACRIQHLSLAVQYFLINILLILIDYSG